MNNNKNEQANSKIAKYDLREIYEMLDQVGTLLAAIRMDLKSIKNNDKWMTIDNLGIITGWSRDEIEYLIEQKTIPHAYVDGKLRFPTDKMEEFITSADEYLVSLDNMRI